MSDTIRVLLVKPMQPPLVAEIPADLKGLQKTVGGYIEAIYPYPDAEIALVCDEEGKLSGKPLNRALRDEDGHIYDIVAGDFFICDASGENFGSLSDEQIQRFTKEFQTPEVFVKINGEIAAIPLINSTTPRNNDAR